jgi:hypothetical protein
MFAHHVFISYAHIDNRPVLSDEGWVTIFHRTLEKVLSMRLGENANIWFDSSHLQGNSALTPEIEKGLKCSALLVTILSPSYYKSEWCRQELERFCELADNSGGLYVEGKARLLKVVKLPEPREKLPSQLQDILDYCFHRDIGGGNRDQLDPWEHRSEFVSKITRLAAEATPLIKKLCAISAEAVGASGTNSSITPEANPISVYLAECTLDMRTTRDKLAADLKQSGCRVLPDSPLPQLEKAKFSEAVLEACQKCDISIHLIGSSYGVIPETLDPNPRSVVELQNEIAAKLASQRGGGDRLHRLIWRPAQLEPSEVSQKKFLERLESEASLQEGADLICGDFAELTTNLHRLVKARRKALAAPLLTPSGLEENEANLGEPRGKPMVYLVCTKEDLQEILPLKKCLKKEGCDVELPLFEGDATKLRCANEERMKRCSSVIHFYGAGTDSWLATLRDEISKINLYQPGKPLEACALYIASPETALKRHHLDDPHDNYTQVIDGLQGFDPSLLSSLIEALQSGAQPNA